MAPSGPMCQVPYEYYLIEVGRKAPGKRREYMQLQLMLPPREAYELPPNPNVSTQVCEADLDVCVVKPTPKKGKGKKGKKGKKKR